MSGHGKTSMMSDLYSPRFQITDNQGPAPEGRFGRMFSLSPSPGENQLAPHPSPVYDLHQLGAPLGPMDESVSGGSSTGSASVPAGYTFLGQFIDHDITLDTTSKLDMPAVPEALRNFRTPNLDLDCVYGGGPESWPFLYNGPFLRKPDTPVGSVEGNTRWDHMRIGGRAVIGDPRNDENLIVSQLQTMFISLHNEMVKLLSGFSDEALVTRASPHQQAEWFEAARDHTIHCYHRLIIEDFLPHVIGETRTQKIANEGRRHYFPGGFYNNVAGTVQLPFMPVEFSVAAYRYGHSQVRDEYKISACRSVPLFSPEPAERIFGFEEIDEQNLIDWGQFYTVSSSLTRPQSVRPIDPKLPSHLFALHEVGVVPSDVRPSVLGSLAARNLNRGRSFRLPSGQALARVMGFTPLETDDACRSVLGDVETPLWYYVLQEAAETSAPLSEFLPDAQAGSSSSEENGNILGDVGGTIVGEVLIGLLDHYREVTGKGLDFVPSILLETSSTQIGQRILMEDVLKMASVVS